MQNIKKYFMTLALLLTAVTGAWAQSSLNVVELEEVPADWETDNSLVTAADLPGFNASTLAKARAWTGAPAEGFATLIYAIDDNLISYVEFYNGQPTNDSGTFSTMPKNQYFIIISYSIAKIYYTAGPTEWELKPDETGKNWTLAEMPASNVELQAEYFAESNLFLSKDALADKANIVVKNGETDVAFDDDGKSTTTVTEGTAMTVKFTGKKVLGMKVEKKAKASTPSLNITSPEVGQVIGSDGKNYAYGSLPTGVTAVAKICYVSGSNGLALALTDEEGKMNWSTAQTTCAAHTAPFTSGTWKLASQDEWNNMISAVGSHDDLRDGFSSVGGTNMQSGNYWSSTGSGSDDAFYYDFEDSGWYNGGQGSSRNVRACLAF